MGWLLNWDILVYMPWLIYALSSSLLMSPSSSAQSFAFRSLITPSNDPPSSVEHTTSNKLRCCTCLPACLTDHYVSPPNTTQPHTDSALETHRCNFASETLRWDSVSETHRWGLSRLRYLTVTLSASKASSMLTELNVRDMFHRHHPSGSHPQLRAKASSMLIAYWSLPWIFVED